MPAIARRPTLDDLFKLRPYTAIARISHRRNVARLLAGVPPYAIETMRRHHVPREWRICRFCQARGAVEDESHILFSCPDPALVAARELYFVDILAERPSALHIRRRVSDWAFLAMTLMDEHLVTTAAAFVHSTFEICKATPPYEILTDEDWAGVPEAV
ncbi:uncharacterized protein TRAVEDRAFT_54882 [Trametes versicolor FP-101664 SS1]|uniref:Reverse transcriptase zinc-binding domain-containing protein n=1 Tax=Trametes versicolor (strain FP-101664) TaxID=717944 RepID=R7S610_TRAVS|nr:uncharacterized protein TRAVEDRAFT_54882 [Trametes versicolor FP-101664 SS1]EIW51116.1 hypothetical protein TRAVEDRAFT_54882 [Trametes versicolor FP-101664 SS1]